ncbi:MAG: hypothetical protein CMC35_02265 [Flavobacteriaceae bacterium]|nr:hypothetical protein [Flavobacteriaceae bacterium]|tara:strand:+ start:30022 stop:30726 length:705 start_codon:yes stop_codon:yes gene_type:complete
MPWYCGGYLTKSYETTTSPFFCILFTIASNAQSENDTRKGSLLFNIGSEYRITPLPYEAEFSLKGLVTNVDGQNSGVAFHYGLDYFITKNLKFGFANSFRYDLLVGSIDNIDFLVGVQGAKQTLIIGYHFHLDYYFPVFKNSELFIRAGRSLLNTNTDTNTKQTFFDEDGEIVAVSSESGNYAFAAWNIAVGYKKERFGISIGIYSSSVTDYFVETTTLNIPYINLTYTIGKIF